MPDASGLFVRGLDRLGEHGRPHRPASGRVRSGRVRFCETPSPARALLASRANRRATHIEIDRTNGSSTLTTTYSYDSRGNVAYLVNGKGDPTMWVYDGLSRMTEKRVALTSNFSAYIKTAWGFDKNDRLTSHKDDANNETTWQYDALDRGVYRSFCNSSSLSLAYEPG